ncbi:PilN domain-containing protein [Snuella lapsa]|uniref:General secretion pathway protein n=1 Tax=Snuella lapsa TaxID=870481 RepID=A0ABP6WP70_9FLAO
MVSQFKSYLTFGNRFCGVEHTVQNGKDVIFATLLKKSKKVIDVSDTFKETSLEILATKLPKKQHIFLTINNDNVLTKRLESTQTDAGKLAYGAFPNINLEDFYYEVISYGIVHFVSICRKAYIETLLETYKAQGLPVINISVGNLIVSGLCNFINTESITTSNAHIAVEESVISAIDKVASPETIDYYINGLQINSNHLLSLAGALDLVLQHGISVTNAGALQQSLNNNYKYTRFYTLFLKFAAIFILGLLLINFFIFNHYFNSVNALQQTSQVNEVAKQKVLELNEQISKSEKMVDDMLKSSESKSAFYLNAIIQGLPSTILLSGFNYQPILKRIKKDQLIEVDRHTIVISGISNDSSTFSKWMTNLESFNWVDKVNIANYEDVSESVSDFSIKLDITNDQQN